MDLRERGNGEKFAIVRKVQRKWSNEGKKTLEAQETTTSSTNDHHDAKEAEEGTNEFVIDKILSQTRCPTAHESYEYLVKWFGFSEPTWQPTRDFYRSTISQFCANNKLQLRSDITDAMSA